MFYSFVTPWQRNCEFSSYTPGPLTLTSMHPFSMSPWGGVGAMDSIRRSAASRCCCVHFLWSVWSPKSNMACSSNWKTHQLVSVLVSEMIKFRMDSFGAKENSSYPEALALRILVLPFILIVIHKVHVRVFHWPIEKRLQIRAPTAKQIQVKEI